MEKFTKGEVYDVHQVGLIIQENILKPVEKNMEAIKGVIAELELKNPSKVQQEYDKNVQDYTLKICEKDEKGNPILIEKDNKQYYDVSEENKIKSKNDLDKMKLDAENKFKEAVKVFNELLLEEVKEDLNLLPINLRSLGIDYENPVIKTIENLNDKSKEVK